MATVGQIGVVYGNIVDELTYVLLNQLTVFTIKTINVNHYTCGTVTVNCIAVDSVGASMTKEKKFRFRKDETGVLTIANMTATFDPNPDASMTGCNFDIINANEQLAIRVIGATGVAKQILWQISINPVNIVSFNQY